MDNRELFEAFILREYGEPAWLEQDIFGSDLYIGWQACAEQKDKEIAALKTLLLRHIKLYRVGDELLDKDAIALSIMYMELDRNDK